MRHAPLLTIRLVLLPSRVGPATQQSTTGASGHVTVTSEMIFMLGWPPGWRGEPWPLPPRPQQLPLSFAAQARAPNSPGKLSAASTAFPEPQRSPGPSRVLSTPRIPAHRPAPSARPHCIFKLAPLSVSNRSDCPPRPGRGDLGHPALTPSPARSPHLPVRFC